MEHPIIALSFQHKRFSRLDVLTALGDRAGESQRLLLPRAEEFSGKVSPPPQEGETRLQTGFVLWQDLIFYLIFISYQVITLDPSSQNQLSFGR